MLEPTTPPEHGRKTHIIQLMNANFKLLPEAVAIVGAADKAQILALLAERLAAAYALDRDEVLEGLEEREKLGSTGFGSGVAIPHARIEGLKHPVAALLKLETSVNFDSADGMPVDLVIGLLSPSNAGVAHLHALAAISRMVRDEATYEALTGANDVEALNALLTNLSGSGIDRDAA